MKWLRAPMLALVIVLIGVLPGDQDPLRVASGPADLPRENVEFTFFAWSDQHVTMDGEAGHLLPALEAMRRLPGRPYPPGIGDAVARPLFIFSAGDCTDWPTRAAVAAYDRAMARTGLPHFEIIGNHDEGDGASADAMRPYIASRHGSPSYAFDCGGVRFLCLFSPYESSQRLSADSLAWLRKELSAIPRGRPVIMATHLSFDALHNRDELVDCFGDANVILILGGHLHRTRVNEYRGYPFLQLPSPKGSNEIIVIRLGMDRLVAIPFDYRRGTWSESPATTIDRPIHRGARNAPER